MGVSAYPYLAPRMTHGFEGVPTAHRHEHEERNDSTPREHEEERARERQPVSPDEVRRLLEGGEPVAAERVIERVENPRDRAGLYLEIAANQRAFNPRELLMKGREALKEIADPHERAQAQRAFAQEEMEKDFGLFSIEAISDIDDPHERLEALGDLHEYFWGENGSRLVDPEMILDAAEKAAQEMGEGGSSAEVLTKLALLSFGYRRGVAETFLDKIADPADRAEAYLTAADADRINGNPDRDFLDAAHEALHNVSDAQRRADIQARIKAIREE